MFEAKKKDEKYEEASEIYRDAMSCDKSRGSSDKMLKLQTSFAEMQITQGNSNEAERILSDILKWSDLPSSIKKQCSVIRGKILCTRKRYGEAEDLYRKLYDRASKDEVTLEMGDELCNVIALQGDLDRAQIEHINLVEKRKKILGTGHSATVKSANKAVENARKLIQKLPRNNEFDVQRNAKRKQVLEADIEYLLRDIWGSFSGTTQKQEDILKVGFGLGLSLSNQGKFYQAEPVLYKVWEGRKARLGHSHMDTLSTGIWYSQALYRQDLDPPMNSQDLVRIGHHQDLSMQLYVPDGTSKCQKAAAILSNISAHRDQKAYTNGYPIATVANAHLGVICAKLEHYERAAQYLMTTMNITVTGGEAPMPPPKLMSYALDMVRLQQYRALDPRYKSSRKDKGVSRRSTRAPLAITGSFNAPSIDHSDPLERGRRLMNTKSYNRAAKLLGQAWKAPPSSTEDRRSHILCGEEYVKCLTKIGDFDKAERIRGQVRTLKRQQPNLGLMRRLMVM